MRASRLVMTATFRSSPGICVHSKRASARHVLLAPARCSRIRRATGSLELESRDLEAEVAARDAREQDLRQDAHSLLRLALLGPRLVRRRGRDPLRGLV